MLQILQMQYQSLFAPFYKNLCAYNYCIFEWW